MIDWAHLYLTFHEWNSEQNGYPFAMVGLLSGFLLAWLLTRLEKMKDVAKIDLLEHNLKNDRVKHREELLVAREQSVRELISMFQNRTTTADARNP